MSNQERKKLVYKRSVVKRRITNTFNNIETEQTAREVSVRLIQDYLTEIRACDAEINEYDFSKLANPDEMDEACEREIDSQTDYFTEISSRIASLCSTEVKTERAELQASGNVKLRLPELSCDTFTGEGTSHLEYHSFISCFNNVVGSSKNISGSTKLSYLKNYLKGYASKLIQHLQIRDENYSVAIDILNNEFLNIRALVDDLLQKFLDLKPKFDNSYLQTKIYINDVRCILTDLKGYDYDFFSNVSSNALISHIMLQKLPYSFRQELVRKLDENFPTIEDIFENYSDIIRTLNIRAPTKNPEKVFSNDNNKNFTPSNKFSKPIQNSSATYAITSGKKENVPATRYCKFCNCQGHSMISCKKYSNLDQRRARCVELGLCYFCTSQKHNASNCKSNLDFTCYYCNAKNHISALCGSQKEKISANICLNSNNQCGKTYILPTLMVTLGNGKSKTQVKCLLDTGSQRSYLSDKILDRIGIKGSKTATNIMVNTFLNSGVKQFREECLSLNFHNNKRSFAVPFLVNKDVDISYCVEGLTIAYKNIQESYELADPTSTDHFQLEGLLGIDTIQLIGGLEMHSCLGGVCFRLGRSVIPFGNVDAFLTNSQLSEKYSKNRKKVRFEVEKSSVNCILNPIKTNIDPIGSVINDSLVDDRLDNLFSLESLGITEEFSDYDQKFINEFNSNLKIKNGKYHVTLPWTEKISSVQNNFDVSRAVLEKVISNLNNNNLYESYNDILKQQLADGIIEPVNLNLIDKNDIP